MRLIAVIITTLAQISVGIFVLVKVCSMHKNKEMGRAQMILLILVIALGIILFTCVVVFFSLIATSEPICPVCIATLAASEARIY